MTVVHWNEIKSNQIPQRIGLWSVRKFSNSRTKKRKTGKKHTSKLNFDYNEKNKHSCINKAFKGLKSSTVVELRHQTIGKWGESRCISVIEWIFCDECENWTVKSPSDGACASESSSVLIKTPRFSLEVMWILGLFSS